MMIKKFLFSIVILMSFNGFAESVISQRIFSYVQQARIDVENKQYNSACKFYETAKGLASINEVNKNFLTTIEAELFSACSKSVASTKKITDDYLKRAIIIEFCTKNLRVVQDCAVAGDINKCVEIRANGITRNQIIAFCRN